MNTVWPSADASDYSFFKHVMIQSTYFIRGFSISIKSVMKDDREDLAMRCVFFLYVISYVNNIKMI